ncbi:MAG: AAA family ATPase [Clostridiales bacterium]|nr:AAA family ATPase [Clostridiales bacterium]
MKIIYGPKGTGKTKAIIESANNALDEAKGHVIFITDTKRYTYDLKYQIRFLDVTGFDVQGADRLRGFIKGIVAANGDNEYIFIDGIARIAGAELKDLGDIFAAMEKLEADYGVKFIVTCSAAKEDLPEFVLKYVD